MLRPHLANMLARHVPQLPVLAYDEIGSDAQVDSIGTVSSHDQGANLALATAT
jgi:flagellar biosynthesis component FlhA